MYLTESKLHDFIKELYVGHEIVCNKGFRESGIKCRPDFHIPSISTIIEFDGYQHYTLSKVVASDSHKTKTFMSMGYKVIRIPYFVQLCPASILYFFGIDMPNFTQAYPHGFIDDKAVLPADFCSIGVERFHKELEEMPANIEYDIRQSLRDRAKILGIDLVYPLNFNK